MNVRPKFDETIAMKLPASMVQRLDQVAAAQFTNRSTIVRQAVARLLTEQEAKVAA